jgi:transcriptional regulator with XRE-family HTH domain
VATATENKLLAAVEARRLITGAGRMIRESAGLSLADVAAVLEVDASTVWSWEHNTKRPTVANAVAYAELLEKLRTAYASPRRRVQAKERAPA